jgi:hypothetical protein
MCRIDEKSMEPAGAAQFPRHSQNGLHASHCTVAGQWHRSACRRQEE